VRAAAKFGDAGERGEGEVQSRITLAEPVADQFIAVTWHGAWLRTQSAGVPVMLCAEVGVPQGLDHLVQAVEDFPVPASRSGLSWSEAVLGSDAADTMRSGAPWSTASLARAPPPSVILQSRPWRPRWVWRSSLVLLN
jgi:hypothetical protein